MPGWLNLHQDESQHCRSGGSRFAHGRTETFSSLAALKHGLANAEEAPDTTPPLDGCLIGGTDMGKLHERATKKHRFRARHGSAPASACTPAYAPPRR